VFQGANTGVSFIYYGQNKYTSFASALQNISTDSFVESPTSALSLTFIGYIIAEGSTTDLSDTNANRIIQAGLFRNTAGSSGGGSSTTQNINDLNDVTTTTPSNGQALVYSSGLWVNGTPSSASYALTATTASYALNSVSASYSATASYALNASSAQVTGSYTVNSGVQSIISSTTGSNYSAFYNYTIVSGSNTRAGQLMLVWNGASINSTDVSTVDIGNTAQFVFTASLNAGSYVISSAPTTSGWLLKTMASLL
jgi:hypothetical protein